MFLHGEQSFRGAPSARHEHDCSPGTHSSFQKGCFTERNAVNRRDLFVQSNLAYVEPFSPRILEQLICLDAASEKILYRY